MSAFLWGMGGGAVIFLLLLLADWLIQRRR